jgi:hypothetical protein
VPRPRGAAPLRRFSGQRFVLCACQRVVVGQKATDETVTGERGIAMIADAIGRMGHIWRPGAGATDFGIDGDIELRDPGTGEVRNVRIGVQSRATTKKWAGETDDAFHYTPSKRHVEYWLSSNQPVLLICSRPPTGEIYWRSIQEWARDPTLRATRRVTFDKRRDVFDETVRDKLFDLRATAEDRVVPPAPAWVPETLQTNLMPVLWHDAKLYSAAVATSDAKALFAPAHQRGVHHFSAVLRDGYVWSLSPFRDGFLEAIGAEAPKRGALQPWLASDQRTDLNLVRDLVRRTVLSTHHRWLVWHHEKRVAYFRLRGEPEEWKSVAYRWSKGPGRTVVSPQQAKTREGFTGYRHDAAEIAVRRCDGRWYVEVRPTYLFTWDGFKVSSHHDSALSTIKKSETHPAVSQALRMWAHLLGEKLALDSSGREPIALGPLVDVTSPRSIVDKTWKRVTAKELGYSGSGELTLFDLGDLAA